MAFQAVYKKIAALKNSIHTDFKCYNNIVMHYILVNDEQECTKIIMYRQCKAIYGTKVVFLWQN